MFSHLGEAPRDPILGLSRLFAEDAAPDKVDLGIGVYRDEHGVAAVLDCVKLAEQWLVENQASKEYLSSAGLPAFTELTRELVLGAGTDRFHRSAAIQTPGGTGALRAALDFIKKALPDARVFVSQPTWVNHHSLCAAAGLEVVNYDYYDKASGELLFDRMLQTISGMWPGDVVVLHGCCHNPSGADLSSEQVEQVVELLLQKGALPLIDLAYLGFGDGFEADGAALRLIVDTLPCAMIANSYSKNFALYRERVGALTIVAESGSEAERAKAHLLPVVRANYSMPPDHGAAVVARVLGNEKLRTVWVNELAQMRSRINQMRAELAARLTRYANDDYSRIARQRGMFALFGFGAEEVAHLRNEHHVHITGSGRINIAGLTQANVDHVAASLAAVCRV